MTETFYENISTYEDISTNRIILLKITFTNCKIDSNHPGRSIRFIAVNYFKLLKLVLPMALGATLAFF